MSSAKALAAAGDEEEAQNAAAAAVRRITQGAPMGEEGTGAAGHAASEERLMDSAKERDARRNKLKESVFKIEHAGVLGVLGWFL